ncbi:MAG: SGNH/GDSL hydrolase family protein, partial [Microbacteriaceae bacterium]
GLSDCGEDFAGVAAAAAGLQPDVVIVSGSSNDFGTDNNLLLKTTVATLKQIRTEFPKARIIGLSTTWGDIPEPDEISIIDSQMKEALAEVGGTFVDAGQPLSGHPELMQDDHIHPNQAGQVTLELAIERALARVHVVI